MLLIRVIFIKRIKKKKKKLSGYCIKLLIFSLASNFLKKSFSIILHTSVKPEKIFAYFSFGRIAKRFINFHLVSATVTLILMPYDMKPLQEVIKNTQKQKIYFFLCLATCK